jgi:Tol biopolymer transport system component
MAAVCNFGDRYALLFAQPFAHRPLKSWFLTTFAEAQPPFLIWQGSSKCRGDMNRPNTPVSLADLAAAGVRLRSYEAVTLVRELMLQVVRGEVAGVPSAHVIRLSSSGTVAVEGPVDAGGRPVIRAAQLLESLLPAADAGNQFRVPGGLKLALARALGTLDLPPFPSLDSFADALARFAATDAAATVTNLVVSWSELAAASPLPADERRPPAASGHVERFVPARTEMRRSALAGSLTVSDIRRARRSTGMPLSQVATESRVPLPLLRQLEWGYLHNWPTGQDGLTLLARYARATGLDEQLVVGTIAPLLDQADGRRELVLHKPSTTVLAPVAAADPVVEIEELPITPVWRAVPRQLARSRRAVTGHRRGWILAALAVPALLAIGLLPMWPPADDRAAESVQAETSRPAAATLQAAVEPASDVRPSEGDRPAASSVNPATGAIARPEPASARPNPPVGPAYRLAAEGPAYSPSFASVGTAMFFHDNANGPAALVRAEADSSGALLSITRIVDDAAQNFHVRPSPDGSRIAFDSDRGGERGVYIADANGRNVKRISPDGFAAVPSWSPDGSTIAFVRAEPDLPRVWNLWTIDVDTGDLRQVTRHRYGQPWGGSWFPDGRRIAYSHENRLVVHDLTTGAERAFTSPIKGRLLRTPAVSPDGRHVMFQVHRDGGWMLELADGSMRKVLDDPTAEEFTWAPDSRRIAYHSRRAGGWGVWVMAPR